MRTIPFAALVFFGLVAAQVADVRGITRHTYDDRDRVTKVEHPEGGVISYTYDGAGNRESMTTRWKAEAAKTTTYQYDEANRLTQVTGPDAKARSRAPRRAPTSTTRRATSCAGPSRPVNEMDPSGHMTIGGMMTAMGNFLG